MTQEEEIVSHRDEHMNVRLHREAPEKLRESALHLRGIEGEELLELINDEKRLSVPLPPSAEERDPSIRS